MNNWSEAIKQKALELGFLDCGISKAEALNEDGERVKSWLADDMHAEMHYMENHFEKRIDPRLLHEGTCSVISVLLNYYPEQSQDENDNYIISKYAYGVDYHFVMKDKLSLLEEYIQNNIAPINARAFVDSAPVLDRAWAAKSGLGWIGNNSNLISPKHGSFFFIGELLVDIELEYDQPLTKDYCGNCTRCIDACPTGAIVERKRVDANRCISYQTIENRGDIDKHLQGRFKNRIFGCDICQDVCPWNSRSKPHQIAEFVPHPKLLTNQKTDWIQLTREQFSEIFRKSAVKRTKYDGLMRNIRFVEEEE